MNIEQYIEKLCARATEKNLEFQVIFKQKESTQLQVFEQQISVQKYSDYRYLNFKVRINGKIGKVALEKFDESEIDYVIEKAVSNAKVLELDEEFFFYDGQGKYENVSPYKPLPKIDELDKVDYLMSLEKQAYEADNRVNKVISTAFSETKWQEIMRNSLGLNLADGGHSASAYVYLSASDGNNIKTGSEGTLFEKEEDFNPKTLAEKAVKNAVSRLNAIDISSSKETVVFDRKVFAEFLGAIGSIFDAYTVDKGKSKLKDKLGQIVAAANVTIVDNPLLDGGYASSSFDGEGVPTICKKVIEKGVIKTYLCGLAMANKMKTESTGNGTGGLSATTFNFYLENGDLSKEEILSKVQKGVYIDKLNGVRTGLSIVSGDFSFGAEGFLIEKGKLGTALNQFTISGNLYDVLKDIKYIGNDLEFHLSSEGSPTVAVDNITIASA